MDSKEKLLFNFSVFLNQLPGTGTKNRGGSRSTLLREALFLLYKKEDPLKFVTEN